jgi:hypothetical protein
MRGLGASGLGTISWKNEEPDSQVMAYQAACNKALDCCGFQQIAVDGKLGPGTCGAGSVLAHCEACVSSTGAGGTMGTVGPLIAGHCQSFTYPLKKDGKPFVDPARSKCAGSVAWGAALPSGIQTELNRHLSNYGYGTSLTSGVLDAKSCGAMRAIEAASAKALDYLTYSGCNCSSFEDPTKPAPVVPVTPPPVAPVKPAPLPTAPKKTGISTANMLMGGAAVVVAGVGIYALAKHKGWVQ